MPIYTYSSQPMSFHAHPFQFIINTCSSCPSIASHVNIFLSLPCHRNPWISMPIYGYPWSFIPLYATPCQSRPIHTHSCKSISTHTNSSQYMPTLHKKVFTYLVNSWDSKWHISGLQLLRVLWGTEPATALPCLDYVFRNTKIRT